MSTAFNLSVNDKGESVITFVSNLGVIIQIPDDHPNYTRITDALLKGQDPSDYLDVSKAIQAIDGRVTVEGGTVYFEGEPTHNTVSSAILRYQREGRDFTGLVKFLELLFQNPSRRSRDQLFTWLERQGLSVDPDGYFLAFKGVNVRHASDDDESAVEFPVEQYPYESSHAGPGYVDGKYFNGRLPQGIGAVISIERNEVDDDYRRDCSYGLHVGSFGYASTFASVLEEVRVNPADVVTVPEYDTNKLRCASYEVIGIQERKVNDLSQYEAEATWDDELGWDTIEQADVPRSFFQRLKDRFVSAPITADVDDDEIEEDI